MMSDILSETILEIHRYMDEYPEVYGPLKLRIKKVLTEMENLQAILDAPPSDAKLKRATDKMFRTAMTAFPTFKD